MVDVFAVIAGKLSARAIRVLGAGLGSNLPGRVSRYISGDILSNLARQSRLGVLAVSGTNGKSTTSGFVSAILEAANFKFTHNRQGANLVAGITASVIEAAEWTGRLNVDYCLFETDEAALPLVAKEVNINTVVVTNLFRDQLDRFGELDTTASLINKGIAVNKSLAILNSDDPNVAQLAPDSKRTYYGIQSVASSAEPEKSEKSSGQPAAGVRELAYCGKCGNEYRYEQFFYGQLGHYVCASCGHRRPEPNVFADNVRILAAGSQFDLTYGTTTINVEVKLPGMFNVYNALAAAALAFSIGIPPATIKRGLESYSTLFGRSERLTINGKSLLIQLIKNPAGASQAVRAVVNDPNARILVAINDNYADGRDVSWLWDAEFELMGDHKKSIVVSGIRAYDMAVRLKYCGVPTENIQVVPELDQALRTAVENTASGETLWVLPTYTCLLELQKIAKTLGTTMAGT